MQENHPVIEALSKSQILSTIPSGLFLVDCHRRIVYWNREAERITGYAAEEIVGQHCSILEGIECNQGCGLYDHDAPGKPVIGSECQIRTKAGKKIVISKNIDLLYLNGKVVGGIETFIDITGKIKMEDRLLLHAKKLEQTVKQRTEALQEERSHLRTILDSMTDLAYIVTKDLRIDFLNQAMESVLGAQLGKPCYQVIHDRLQACADCPWQDIVNGRTVIEERRFKQDNHLYEVIHTPVYGPKGEIQKLAVCRDITQRKELEEKLKELNRQLDAFVYTVSHDLKSPLTPIIGYAEFLRDNYRDVLDETGLDLVNEIYEQGHRVLNLIQDLLDLSYVGEARQPNEQVDPVKVLEQILSENQSEINDKNIRINYTSLPELLVQESLLYQVFSNLILNAVRYGCDRGSTIEITGDYQEGYVTLKVIDHGPGVPEEERSKVFEIFYRGIRSKDMAGTGIGLATVHKIVSLLNGKVTIEETPGGGCTVKIVLPVLKAAKPV